MKDVPERSSLRSRLGWFALLYLAGVLAVFVLAAALHVLLSARNLAAVTPILERAAQD
jgi:Mg/Co/Ni transporter MgtE